MAIQFNRAFLIAIVANGLFVIFQLIFSYIANSTSLFADAIHNLGDVLALVLGLIANLMVERKPTERRTYGMKKISILVSLINGLLLVFSCGIIATEAVYKLISPKEVQALGIIIVASLGILVNFATALLFLRGQSDLNIRSAFLHLTSDGLVSLGVVISASLIYWTGWQRLDPLMAIIIALVILKSAWTLLADSFRLMIDGVPKGISVQEVFSFLKQQEAVEAVHDLHIWALSTRENALSVHLYTPNQSLSDDKLNSLAEALKSKYNIQHSTIQVEKKLSCRADGCNAYLE